MELLQDAKRHELPGAHVAAPFATWFLTLFFADKSQDLVNHVGEQSSRLALRGLPSLWLRSGHEEPRCLLREHRQLPSALQEEKLHAMCLGRDSHRQLQCLGASGPDWRTLGQLRCQLAASCDPGAYLLDKDWPEFFAVLVFVRWLHVLPLSPKTRKLHKKDLERLSGTT